MTKKPRDQSCVQAEGLAWIESDLFSQHPASLNINHYSVSCGITSTINNRILRREANCEHSTLDWIWVLSCASCLFGRHYLLTGEG